MELRVHLKVCEGCGCLWYRSQAETRVYCLPCLERFKDFPTTPTPGRRGRPKKTTLHSVFAVQASPETIAQERTAAHPCPRFRHRATGHTVCSTHQPGNGGVL
jgi:hypothetical protein